MRNFFAWLGSRTCIALAKTLDWILDFISYKKSKGMFMLNKLLLQAVMAQSPDATESTS